MDPRLLEMLTCPVCHGKLQFDKIQQQLTCPIDKLIYSINNKIPILIEELASAALKQGER